MGSIPPLQFPNGKKAPLEEIELDGRKYTVEANQRSGSVAGFVGSVASHLLGEWLKGNCGRLPDDLAERTQLFDTLFAQGEEWRLALKRFENKKLEEYESKIRGSTSLILPTAGMMEDHLPPGSIPHLGR